jgi:uncharacterized protein DUF4145
MSLPLNGGNWTCPYCGRPQVISHFLQDRSFRRIEVRDSEYGSVGFHMNAVTCANIECKGLSLEFQLFKGEHDPNGFKATTKIHEWRLLPPSLARQFPHYIPQGLIDDYEEACAIRDLSPKASATLIRRCIQGVIRDFCGINKKRLIDEITELRRLVDAGQAPPGVQPEHVEAIDNVREIGNIGAHMEADINVIVDVEPDEAQLLIELTELLFEEWYVVRKERSDRLAKLNLIAQEKQSLRKPKPAVG